MAVDDYVLPLSRLVHQFKFSSQIALAQPLARLLLLAVLQARRTRGLPPVDTLVNVPLFQPPLAAGIQSKRPAVSSARPLAGLPVPRLCTETYSCHCRSAPAQRPVAQKEPENAFRLELPVNGLHIAIVDDVVTTGTVAELSRLLLQKRRRVSSGMVSVPYLVALLQWA